MFVLKPEAITDSTMTTDVPEPDATKGEVVYDNGTGYNLGDQVILTTTHRIYENIQASTGENPDPSVNPDAEDYWLDIGPTNAWAMFDGLIGTPTVQDTLITLDLTAGVVISGVAAFALENCGSVQVIVDDPVAGEVYNEIVNIADNSAVTDWYQYYFSPVLLGFGEFGLFDLPAYPNATITVTFNGGLNMSVGAFTYGLAQDLGVALYDSSLKLLDFSRKERDQFGNFTVIPRATSKQVDYELYIARGALGSVFKELSKLTTVPAVYSGTSDPFDPTLVYGYYKDLQINIDAPDVCSASLIVEGLN